MGIKAGAEIAPLTLDEQGLMTLSITVNGEDYKLQVPPMEKLLVILRDHLQFTGTKVSCEIGRCGACSVFVDGQLVNACMMMAYQADGKQVTTIENAQNSAEDAIQQSFLKAGGFQCGYCTSGMVLAVKNLLAHNPDPTEPDIKEALSGNLCRCTGYGGIIRAVQLAIKQQKGHRN